MIVTVYDLIPLREVQILRSWRLDHRLTYGSYLHQVRSAARVIAISQSTAQDVHQRLGIPMDHIDVVYPAVLEPSFVPRAESPEPTFLVVGALDAHKQPDLALRAFAHFRARHGSGSLRYIGPFHHEQARRLIALARQLGLVQSVAIEGRIPDEALEDAYRSATALISTSRVEGFGLPPVEALMRGVPVVAVDSAAARETLSGAAAIVPADPEAIATAMAQPIGAPSGALTLLRERFGVTNVARSLERCYRQVLPDRITPAR